MEQEKKLGTNRQSINPLRLAIVAWGPSSSTVQHPANF